MGQTESASQPRRVDPRWARVALEQLRDEEFLSKQLRRQETIAGARQAAAASSAASRRQRNRVGLFVDARANGSRGGGGGRPLWTALLKPKDAAKASPEGDAEDAAVDASDMAANGKLLTPEQRAQMEEEKEDGLLHALVLLGTLPHAKRAAYLLCHLQAQLARYCAVPDPVAEVTALRKQILSDVYEAVNAQHQHYHVVSQAFRGVVEVLQKAASATEEPDGQRVSCLVTTRSVKTSTMSDQVSQETSLAAQFVLELMGGLLEMTPSRAESLPSSQKRVLLQDIAVLIESIPALSLAPKAQSSGGSGVSRRLIRRLQTFLVNIATEKTTMNRDTHLNGSGSPKAHGPTQAEFNIAERTRALSCLLHLAVAVGSIRDVLVVVCIILGVGETAETIEKDAPHVAIQSAVMSIDQSPKSKPSQPAMPSALRSSRTKDHAALKECENDIEGGDDERTDLSDEMANFAVEQRLKQVHKQRIDLIPKAEMIDGQPTAVDQLLSGHSKRKAASGKSVVVAHTKAAIAHTVVTSSGAASLSTNAAHRISIPQPPSMTHTFSLTGKQSTKAAKDDFNNLVVEGENGFTFDTMSVKTNDLGSPSSPRHAVNVACPKFESLNVGAILKEIDVLKPRTAPRQISLRSMQGVSENQIPGFGLNQHDHNTDDDREVWSCGQNSYGELGHGDTNTRKSFERIEALQQKEIVQVSAGNEHTIALSADGVVWTCGYNDNGQCGLGVTTRINHLTELQKLGDNTPISQVHAYNGCEHTILVTQDGRAASCGYNYRGQLGHGNTQSESVPKIMRSIEGRYVRLVSCSYYHTIITCDSISSSHSVVYTFGRNDYGQLGQNDTIDRKIPQVVEALQDQHVVSVACGQYHSMVVSASGKLFAFGKNDYGQLGVEAVENQLAPVHVKYGLERQTCLEVRCGYYHSLVLTAGAHLYGFGRNDYGQLGLGKASNLAAANVQLQQQRYATPQLVEDLEGKEIVRFACGCYHSVVVSDNGVLYVFGRNNHGQLGTGDTNERLYPFPIDDFVGKRIAMVAAGFYHTLVLTGGKDEDQVDETAAGVSEDNHDSSSAGASEMMEGIGVPKINFATLLASSAVKEILEPSLSSETKKVSTSPILRRRRTTQSDASNLTANDPSCDGDGDDGRIEDPLSRGPIDSNCTVNVSDTPTHSCRLLRHSGEMSPTKPHQLEAGNAVDVAIILIAQLERLCRPYTLKQGSAVPVIQQIPVAYANHFVSSTTSDFEFSDQMEGCSEAFSIDISSTTFKCLGRLIVHLSSRRIDASSTILSSLSSTASSSGRKMAQTASLQTYLLSACIRLLHANLHQLIRTGVGSLLIAFSRVALDDGRLRGPASAATSELKNLSESMKQIRSALMSLLEKPKHSGTSSSSHFPESGGAMSSSFARVCTGAVDVLMLAFEIFFPCPSSQSALLTRVMGVGNVDAEVVKCSCCEDIDWTMLTPKKATTKRLLTQALLKRLIDDSIIARMVVIDTMAQSPPLVEKSRTRPLHRVIDCLLERVESDFMRAIGDLAASQDSRDSQEIGLTKSHALGDSSSDAVFSLLNTIQKHLAAWAKSCSAWKRAISSDSKTPLQTRLARIAFQALRLDQGADESDDLPLQWRDILEFALSVVGYACDSLTQLLPRNQLSPTCGGRYHEEVFADPAFHERLMGALQKSIVGQLLPSLIDGLANFAHIPVFAVTLLPALISATRLLDQWNEANALVKRAAESDFVDRFGRSITPSAVLPSSSRIKSTGATSRRPGPQTVASFSSRGDKSSLTNSPQVPMSEALAAPWSLLLEKQLGMLCAEMAATISIGDPVMEIVEHSSCNTSPVVDTTESIAKWQTSALFKGGICSDYLHDSVFPNAPFDRIVPHAPRTGVHGPLGLIPTFSIPLPPRQWEQGNSSLNDKLPEEVLRCLTQSRIRRFVMAMTGIKTNTSAEIVDLAHALCEWMRTSYATKDPAYRMLTRQSERQKQVSTHADGSRSNAPDELSDTDLEDAFFAALLHHSSLEMFAFLIALQRRSSSSTGTRLPPQSLMSLWRVVADLRRRYVARRTSIKNSVESNSEAVMEIIKLQRAILDRSQLLVIVDVYEVKQHEFSLLDSGFVAPWDPALLFRASLMVESSKTSLRSHLNARFGEQTQPFLAAYPTSRWRLLRTLFHIVMRWKYGTRSSPTPAQAVSEALVFVTAEVSDVGSVDSFAYHLLVDPCCRLSRSTRGFEVLVELFHLSRLESVKMSVVQQLTQTLIRSQQRMAHGNRLAIVGANASFQYHEMRRNAQNDLIATVMELLCTKANEVVSGECDRIEMRAHECAVLVLLRCLGSLPITDEQYAFVNDLGIVEALQDLLTHLDEDSKSDQLTNQNDSIRSIVVGSSRGVETSSLPLAVWALLRRFALQFAASTSESEMRASVLVPAFPGSGDVFASLQTCGEDWITAQRALSQTTTADRLLTRGGSTNSSVRRSFEIIVAPRRFSPFKKGLICTYRDMTQPASSALLAMSPLVKPNEFSITTWLYIPASSARVVSSNDVEGAVDEKQIVFVRGDKREIVPYLLLHRDLDNNWQLEVGVAIHAGQPSIPTSSFSGATRLLWERLNAKDAVPCGRWTHVAIVLEGPKIRLYINGTLDSQRSLSGPLAVAMSCAKVELDVSFGRQQPVVDEALDDVNGCDPSGARQILQSPLAMAFLTALLAATASSKVLLTPSSSVAKPLVRSFDGLLSHFRFHNRSLSPIHVRIVYDEKKPVKENEGTLSSRNTAMSNGSPAATKLLQLHSVIRVLIGSDEGRVHLREPSWSVQLWQVFMMSKHDSLQLSSLRLLREILPFLSPDAVSNAMLTPESGSQYCFIRHLIAIIGACISMQERSIAPHNTQYPLPTSMVASEEQHPASSIELRNSAAEQLTQVQPQGLSALALANELSCLLGSLVSDREVSWTREIWQVVKDGLSASAGNGIDLRTGCLYLLGGVAEVLSPGVAVKLGGTQERATIVALDDRKYLSGEKRPGPSGAESHKSLSTVFVAVDETPEALKHPGRERGWLNCLISECASFQQKITQTKMAFQSHKHQEATDPRSEFAPYVRLHRDDLSFSPAISHFPLLSSQPNSHELFCTFLDHLSDALCASGNIAGSFPVQGAATSEELNRWLSASLGIRAALRAASTPQGAKLLLGNTKITHQLLDLSTQDDCHPQFNALVDVERRLWVIRARLYHVFVDLEEQAELEVAQWFTARHNAVREASIIGVSSSSHMKQEEITTATSLGRQGLDDGTRESFASKPRKTDFTLDLTLEDSPEEIQQSSRRSSGDSSAVDKENEDHAGGGHVDSEREDDENAGDEDGGDDDDEDEDEEDEDDNEDDEEADEEHRQEFVDELMMMGFPEEWCVLALKQTRNDIVSASAWIVDNLDYLSRLQSSLDKQRDESTDKLAYEDEDDDLGECEGTDADGVAATNTSPATTQSHSPVRLENAENLQSPSDGFHGAPSPLRPDGAMHHFINEKEMGRKIFGEMYFPFEDGGFDSNTRSQLGAGSRAETKMSATGVSNAGSPENATDEAPQSQHTPDQQLKAGDSVDQLVDRIESLELHELLDHLVELERAFLVVSARQVLLTLLNHADGDAAPVLEMLVQSPLFMKFLRLTLFRGEQFRVDQGDETLATDTVMTKTLHRLVTRGCDTKGFVTSRLLDLAIAELDVAAKNPVFEASLWTQRELRRSDRIVLDEPAVELAQWLVEIVLQTNQCLFLSAEYMESVLERLRATLRSTNLPVKHLGITTMSRVLRQLQQQRQRHPMDELLTPVLQRCCVDIEGFLHAAKNRFIRERVQHRIIFSLYLQAYVEILHLLNELASASNVVGLTTASLSPPITTSCLPNPISGEEPPVSRLQLSFDRKKIRSTLVQISEDGLTATYSGNELWKTVTTTRGFATGVHEWHVRVEKTPSSYLFIGVATRRANTDSFLGADDQSWGFIGDKALYYQRNRLRVYGDSFGEGDVVGVHLNCELGTLAFSKNGVQLGVAFENLMDEVFPAVAFYSRHQKVSLVLPIGDGTDRPSEDIPHGVSSSEGTVEEAVIVCEMLEAMVSKKSLRPELMRLAHMMTANWLEGSGRHIVTRSGGALWVDTTKQACGVFGFQADDRVRTPRGNGRVLGVADNRLWIEVDGERGAWHIHPSRLRALMLAVVDRTCLEEAKQLDVASEDRTSSVPHRGTPISTTASQMSSFYDISESAFTSLSQDKLWSLQLDRAILHVVNEHCESASISPWNVPPRDIISLVGDKANDIEQAVGVTLSFDADVGVRDEFERKLLARFGLLRFLNAYLSRVIGFFDLTWQYFAPETGLTPCRLLTKCRGSVFTSIKNEFFTALMEKTANAPKKADDEYDYPDDLTQMLINRPKAATAKCHPGTTKSLLLSMFGQSFEELHFLPLRMLRMVYSHPMDDGQLRSFKVKFEGEGVDDYGGPYREFFSQFFAELQMICTGEEGEEVKETGGASGSETTSGVSFLPFFMPSPNWRNGVGSNRDKFVLNGGLLNSRYVGSARVIIQKTTPVSRGSWAENPEVKRQLLSEMCHFLGQMLGICLRTRVCVRLDLAESAWKQLVGEDDEDDDDTVLNALKETDFVAHTLVRTLRTLHDEYAQANDVRRVELEEELAAMDLSMTTYLSDGRQVELCDRGQDKVVTMASVDDYVKRVLAARRNEARDVVKVIKEGIHSIIPVAALGLLTWQELEKRMCGVAEVDVELLKQNTEYDEDLTPKDEFIQRFWRVLGSMEEEDKRAFLRFVWARSRLPVGTAQFHQKFKIQSLASSTSGSDAMSNTGASGPSNVSVDCQLPKSHTCFFALQLPRYSSDEICRRQLLYAIHNCVEMDGDFRLADTEMTGWTEINPNDQLRF